jgi:murein DD-endopeptidase MepM/ murein hydrolase activator NlpD
VHPVKHVVSPHKGIDLAYGGGSTADVVAAADGEVVFTGFEGGGAGNYVKINHRSGSGQLLCQSVYMHLRDIYVKPGQKVAAGQKIGHEGNTGIGTGAHLHFECRLISADTTWIDPLPLIRGTLDVAVKTRPDNTADGTSSQTSNARLTGADAEARSGGCAPFGPDYPADPSATNDPLPPASSPFEAAWRFTMRYEVGPHWETAPQYSPGDSELDAGLKDTTAQRKKTGYKNQAGFPGGETKFGIAQGPNPSINVGAVNYSSSKQVGYNNYWLKGPNSYEGSKPKTAVMLFDMFYLHGPGNVKGAILPAVNISGLSDADACRALQSSQESFISSVVAANPSRKTYRDGWLTRSKALLAYALSLP